jgi:hypothetical protein
MTELQARLDTLSAVAADWQTEADAIAAQGIARVNDTFGAELTTISAARVAAQADRQLIADALADANQIMTELGDFDPAQFVQLATYNTAIAARVTTVDFNAAIAARVLQTTFDAAIAARVRTDTSQGLTADQQRQARKNINADHTGMVFFWPSGEPPAWALALDGAAINRASYADLWTFAQASGSLAVTEGAKTAGQFGPGNGTSTFSLPNLTAGGEFIRSKTSGRTIASSELDAFQGHFHNLSTTANVLSPGAGASSPFGGGSMVGGAVVAPVSDSVNGTPRTATETRPRNVAYVPCIVY